MVSLLEGPVDEGSVVVPLFPSFDDAGVLVPSSGGSVVLSLDSSLDGGSVEALPLPSPLLEASGVLVAADEGSVVTPAVDDSGLLVVSDEASLELSVPLVDEFGTFVVDGGSEVLSLVPSLDDSEVLDDEDEGSVGTALVPSPEDSDVLVAADEEGTAVVSLFPLLDDSVELAPALLSL